MNDKPNFDDGGKRCLSNLQYLSKEDNRKKAARLYWNRDVN